MMEEGIRDDSSKKIESSEKHNNSYKMKMLKILKKKNRLQQEEVLIKKEIDLINTRLHELQIEYMPLESELKRLTAEMKADDVVREVEKRSNEDDKTYGVSSGSKKKATVIVKSNLSSEDMDNPAIVNTIKLNLDKMMQPYCEEEEEDDDDII